MASEPQYSANSVSEALVLHVHDIDTCLAFYDPRGESREERALRQERAGKTDAPQDKSTILNA